MIIINTKISMNKWLYKNNKYSDTTNKDIIDYCFQLFVNIIDNFNNIKLVNSYDLYDDFTNHIFNEYVYPINYSEKNNNPDIEHIELLCEEDIINLFIHFKNFTKSCNSDLFHKKNDCAYSLVLFFINNVELIEYISDSDDDIDDYDL